MSRLEEYIRANAFEIPTLVLDIDKVESNYNELKAGMPSANIHYAVKANPHPAILSRLVKLGCRFDAASTQEIQMCLDVGAKPTDISYGNTIKRASDIAWAWSKGILLFSADSEEELAKLAVNAPGCQVFIRLLVSSAEAEWPLSRKFGCSTSYAIPLLDMARDLGLDPVGLSFHVGSQTKHPYMWYDCLDTVAAIWNVAREEGHDLWLLNIGGGFPAYYGVDITGAAAYGAELMAAIDARFDGVTYVMAEPGRGMTGSAGAIAAECVLVSRKTPGDPVRWVYLNVGRFSGLAEAEGESIKYQFVTIDKESEKTTACIVAGPTCDSADVLYERNKVEFPVSLTSGDRVIIKTCGAYTSTYSTVAFNGFPPLSVVAMPSST
jgi:ornithine decarboxylase